MYSQRNSDEKSLYEGANTLAHLLAEAILKAMAEKQTSNNQVRSPLVNEKGEKLVFSVAEAGKVLGISDNTIRTLINTGKIKAVRVGRRILIPRRGLEELLTKDNLQ
jgi:excisionase family DNA binding protein